MKCVATWSSRMFVYIWTVFFYCRFFTTASTTPTSHSFLVGNTPTEYVLFNDVTVTKTEAETLCRSQQQSSHLAIIDNQMEAQSVINGLLELKRTLAIQGPVWIQGSVLPGKTSPLALEDIIEGHGLDSCVSLTDWDSETKANTFHTFRFYQRRCDWTTKLVLCEVDPIPPFKYLIAQGKGRCPEGTHTVINGSIYMTASTCTNIGGKHDGTSRDESMTICFLDWCTVQEPVGGWAFSVNGLCASKRYFKAGIRLNSMCNLLRGQFEYRGFANGQTCWIQLCYLGETPPSRDTFAFSGTVKCPVDREYSMASVYTRTDDCFRVGGQVYGERKTPYVRSNYIQCLIKACRLGTDCKQTQHGREYRGSLDRTISGRKCQRWDSQVPHRHANTNPDWFPDVTLNDANNFCRNPGSWVEGPYCYTTDPKVTWEICDLPFCKGSGPEVTSFNIGDSKYIFVPGLHNAPAKYCQKIYGAGLAFIQDTNELEKISEQLMNLVDAGLLQGIAEIWVAGKTQLVPDVLVDDFNKIVNEDWPENCLLLSRWNASAFVYNNRQFDLYSTKCQLYVRNFLCELVEVRIPNFQVYGGKEQTNISDELTCKISCIPPCTGVDYNVDTKRCYFVFGDTVCRAGKWNGQVVHIRKKSCECNRYLVTGSDGISDDKITASSVYNGSAWNEIHSAANARLTSYEIVKPEGTVADAWVADISDIETPWIQVEFPSLREVYGVVIAGRPERNSWVSRFTVAYSVDCQSFTGVKDGVQTAIFDGNRNSKDSVTVTFPTFILARCVRIRPRSWQESVSMKFDLIGCVSSRLNLALNKPTQQDSTMNGHDSARAVDGYDHGMLSWNKCTHTRPTPGFTWWMVNLEDTYRITEVLITNREDCCSGRLVPAQIYVTKTFSKTFTRETLNSSARCGIVNSVPVARREEISIVCGEGIIGRHVIIVSEYLHVLSLCEVKVYGEKVETINFALGKSASQSSTENYLGYASNAVDGNHNTIYQYGFCSQTTSENKPWWAVNLGFEVKVESVLITNRGDCCGEQLSHFTILVGDTLQHGISNMHKCVYIEEGLDDGVTRHIICDKPVSGRVVKIQLDYAGPLTLCEVEVYGERAQILTFGGTAKGAPCHFPFMDKKGVFHDQCIMGSKRHDWCGTSANDTAEWGYCQDVRLVGGRYKGEGRVEVRRNITWGGVCDDGWDDVNSRVTCSQLGYDDGRAIYPPFFPTGHVDIFISEVMCRGNETGLVACDYMDGTWHACSTHEDAGVQCYNDQDTTFYHGAPAISRRYNDEWWSGVILLPSPDIIPYHGRIIAWEVYAIAPVAPSDILTLQVWRYLGKDNFVLIGSNDIVVPSKGHVHSEVFPENQISVMPGDVFGIKFLQNNPVPFSYSFACLDDTVYYFQNISDLYVGDVVRFQSKTMRNRCKLYSVSAKLEKDESSYLPDFARGSSVYLILAEQHLPLVDAEVQCVLNLGINGTVLRISSAKEYHDVNKELLQRALFGEFWLENVRSDIINLTNSDWLEWARCDPDPGKNCLVLSRESNLEQSFRWKTTTCDKAHLIICERNDGIEEEEDYGEYGELPNYFDYTDNTTQASSYTEKQKMTLKKSASTALVLTIIFLILVAMVIGSVYFFKRWRSQHPVYGNLATTTYTSENEAVNLGHQSEFNNPMYDVALEDNDQSMTDNTDFKDTESEK